MKALLESIARWIDRADAGEITAVIFTAGFAVALIVAAITGHS